MKIQTKYNIGDILYYVATFTNELRQIIKEVVMCKIIKISVYGEKDWHYVTDDGDFYEKELYETREQAVKVLKGEII